MRPGVDKQLNTGERPIALSDDTSVVPQKDIANSQGTINDKRGPRSKRALLWRRFRRHKIAVASAIILAFLYFIAAFAEVIAPHDPFGRDSSYSDAPPQRIHLFYEGKISRPFVYGWQTARDPETLEKVYEVDKTQRYPIYFFVRGEEYKMWGLFEADIHLFGIEGERLYLFGADSLGRGLLSRIIYGTRLSLSIGLVGVFFSLVLGIILGGISGYVGGPVDTVIQRMIEFLRSIPTLPLWMGLSASLPHDWSVIQTYFAITLILSIVGWTDLARVVRGRFLSLRTEEFVVAAESLGAGGWRIISKHLVPNFMGYLIVSVTLAIPSMILAETALSFLGLGLRPPAVSWGVLLQQAQNMTVVTSHPWLLLPAPFIVVTVLAFNFLGDGLRDVFDPYESF